MKIGELARLTGVSERSLRYYEELHLITPARTYGGHRVFAASDVERVIRIQELFAAGLCSRKIGELLPLVAEPAAHRTELRTLLEVERRRLHEIVRHATGELENLEDLIGTLAPHVSAGASPGPPRKR